MNYNFGYPFKNRIELLGGVGIGLRTTETYLEYDSYLPYYNDYHYKGWVERLVEPYISPSIGFRYYLKKEKSKIYFQSEAAYNIGHYSGNGFFEGKFVIGYNYNKFFCALVYSIPSINNYEIFRSENTKLVKLEKDYINMISLRLGYKLGNKK